MKETVLLSFDVEEFDMPLEYQGKIDFSEQIKISRDGLMSILDILKKYRAKATFFATVVFAENNKDLIVRLLEEGHELASHTWYHSQFEISHLQKSREKLIELFNVDIKGLRMPRLDRLPSLDVLRAGYSYDSSINPTWLPGRYNNLKVCKTIFIDQGLIHLPASVSPKRIPLFWLSFHNFPMQWYRHLFLRTMKEDSYVNLYFHPWEFADISNPDFKLPYLAKRNSGKAMEKRFDEFLAWLSSKKINFETYSEFLNLE